MKNKKGFTLIELLVVVAMMGLLAALAIVALNTARSRARDARRVSDIKQIQTALELYYMDNYKYPVQPALNAIEGVCLSSTSGFATPCLGTTYMGNIPSNPEPRTDGGCVGAVYSYYATDLEITGVDLSYYITYCLGSATGDIISGEHFATPAGIADP